MADRFLHTWMPWRMPFLNMRNHRKLLIVDGARAFTGGMNIAAEHSRRLNRGAYVDDIHFQIDGPVARSIMDAFARDWSFITDELLDQDFWWPQIPEGGAVQARGIRSGPDADLYKIEMLVGAALTLAKKRIRIVTPYFLPDQRLQFTIAQACMRGVQVDIVLPLVSDHAYMEWAMSGHLRFFRHVAANIYLSPPPFDHSKLVTMDGEWSLIGSSNWDARSFRLNFEYDVECYDAGLAGKLDDHHRRKNRPRPKAQRHRAGSPSRSRPLAGCRRAVADAISLTGSPAKRQKRTTKKAARRRPFPKSIFAGIRRRLRGRETGDGASSGRWRQSRGTTSPRCSAPERRKRS